MDFYLSDGKTRLLFPLNPESVTATTAARMLTYDSIALGEITFPRGSIPTRFNWEGLLPGKARTTSIPTKSWQDPKVILGLLSVWRTTGQQLRLLVTETPINHNVYIANLEHTWLGGHGDAQYNIDLVEARPLLVKEFASQQGSGQRSKQAGATTSGRPAPPPPKTYTVKKGDTLWGISKRFLGSGSRHNEIYKLNKQTIGPDPNKIKAGQVLRLPG